MKRSLSPEECWKLIEDMGSAFFTKDVYHQLKNQARKSTPYTNRLGYYVSMAHWKWQQSSHHDVKRREVKTTRGGEIKTIDEIMKEIQG